MPLPPEHRRSAGVAAALALAIAVAAGAPLVADRATAAATLNAAMIVIAASAAVLLERRARSHPREAFGWRCLAGGVTLAALYRTWHLVAILAGHAMARFAAPTLYVHPVLLAIVCTGLFSWATHQRSGSSGLRSGLDGFLFGSSVLFVLWAVATHALTVREPLSPVQQAVIMTDLAMAAASLGVVVHLASLGHHRAGGPLTYIGASAAGGGAFAISVGVLSLRGGYYVGHPMDATALTAIALLILAALAPGTVVPPPGTTPPLRRPQAASLLPYLPLAASLVTAALLLNRPDAQGDRLLTALGIAIGMGLLLRQQIALRDVERLSHHLTETVADRTRELARAQSTLARAQRLEAVGRMAGGVARDFERLIGELDAPVALLDGAIPASHPDREAVEEIAAAGRRARRLTTQLLTFAQRQPVEPRRLDVNALVTELLPLLRRLAGGSIVLEASTAPAAATVFADPTQIEQLLSNLTVNARDAMPDGGTLRIGVALAEAGAPPAGVAGPVVQLTVSDTGSGMDDATLAHIFDPFFTTKPAGKGTGLGLPTCYGIVSRAGGRIRVESAPGRGSTFIVDLPRAG